LKTLYTFTPVKPELTVFGPTMNFIGKASREATDDFETTANMFIKCFQITLGDNIPPAPKRPNRPPKLSILRKIAKL